MPSEANAAAWAAEHTGLIADRPDRLVVERTPALDQRRGQALAREIQKPRQAREPSASALADPAVACEPDAQRAWDHGLATTPPPWPPGPGPVCPETDPAPDDVPPTWRVTLTVEAVDAEARQRDLDRRNALVWMTTVPQEERSAHDLRAESKGQVHVERQCHFLKDPLFVDALYVKKPERIAALGEVLLMACLLYSVRERCLRAAQMPIPSPSRRVLTRPPGHEVVRHVASLQGTRDAMGQSPVTLPKIFPAPLLAILEALHRPLSVFPVPPLRDPPS